MQNSTNTAANTAAPAVYTGAIARVYNSLQAFAANVAAQCAPLGIEATWIGSWPNGLALEVDADVDFTLHCPELPGMDYGQIWRLISALEVRLGAKFKKVLAQGAAYPIGFKLNGTAPGGLPVDYVLTWQPLPSAAAPADVTAAREGKAAAKAMGPDAYYHWKELDRLSRQAAAAAAPVKLWAGAMFTDTEHMTVTFLGEKSAKDLPAILSALQTGAAQSPSVVAHFETPGQWGPHGVMIASNLEAVRAAMLPIQAQLWGHIAPGVDMFEDFMPHVTLNKEGRAPSPDEARTHKIDRVALVQSLGGGKFKVLGVVPLRG